MGLINIRPPMMLSGNDSEKLKLLHSYLFQLSEQLNMALVAIDKNNAAVLEQNISRRGSTGSGDKQSEYDELNQQFNEMKTLIIKTAADVRSDMSTLETTLTTNYVAHSEFGDYQEYAENQLSGTATGFEGRITDMQKIITEDLQEWVKNDTGYYKLGLYAPAPGQDPKMAFIIGQDLKQVIVDGEEVTYSENMYAAFTPDRMSFYKNGIEQAYISNNTLFVENAYIRSNMDIGEWRMYPDPAFGFTLKWIGGDVDG